MYRNVIGNTYEVSKAYLDLKWCMVFNPFLEIQNFTKPLCLLMHIILYTYTLMVHICKHSHLSKHAQFMGLCSVYVCRTALPQLIVLRLILTCSAYSFTLEPYMLCTKYREKIQKCNYATSTCVLHSVMWLHRNSYILKRPWRLHNCLLNNLFTPYPRQEPHKACHTHTIRDLAVSVGRLD